MNKLRPIVAAAAMAALLYAGIAEARPGARGGGVRRPAAGGGGGGLVRPGAGGAGTLAMRGGSRTNINGGGNFSHNTRINNNVVRNGNVNVNVNGRGGYYGGGYYGGDWDHHDNFGAGLAVGAVTGAVVGAAVASSHSSTTVVVTPGAVVTALPAGCSTVVVNSFAYQHCGAVWYQPQYAGSTVQYIVINAPA